MNVEELFDGFGPIEQALLAGLFTWFMTAAGAGLVFSSGKYTGKLWMECWDSQLG